MHTQQEIVWAVFRHAAWRPLCLSLICLINLGSGCAWSQEVRILGGVIKNPKTHEHSFTMQFECVEELGDVFALSLAYLNEGHFSNHHRDGVAGQLWINRDVFNRRLSLAAGIGS